MTSTLTAATAVTSSADQRLNLADYLAYSDGTDTLYELVQGELLPMPLGTGLHGDISDFLNMQFQMEIARLNRPWVARQMVIGLQSPRGYRWDTCRIPDVVVLPREQWHTLRQREAVITAGQTPPLLVVEVVSPSTKTTDYRQKRAEYNVLEIPEYWIVDPLEGKITILILVEGLYDAQAFCGDEVLQSPTFPELTLTPNEVLDPAVES
jgi:Uma2 family endonuclease